MDRGGSVTVTCSIKSSSRKQRAASSLDLSEHEAGTTHSPAAGHMRAGGRIGPAPLALFVSGNVAMVVSSYQPSTFIASLSLSLCRLPAQQAAAAEEEYHPLLHWKGKRKASRARVQSRQPIGGNCTSTVHNYCGRHTAIFTQVVSSLVQTAASPRADWDWDLLDRRQASRAFAPGHQPQFFPWSEDSHRKHRTTAPVRQAQAAKQQCPVG